MSISEAHHAQGAFRRLPTRVERAALDLLLTDLIEVIARELGLNIGNTHNHIGAVFKKFGVYSRTAGATGNFIVSGGTNGSTNGITLANQTASGLIDQGTFFGGGDYAFVNGTGNFLRAINYGTDSGSAFCNAPGVANARLDSSVLAE